MRYVKLGVNIDHVATLRQARHTRYPEPIVLASLAEHGGADQITVHLREDRRHIQDRDLRLLRQTVTTALNLELAGVADIVNLAAEVKPQVATFVPERREEVTTEGGLDVVVHGSILKRHVEALRDADVLVSLFVDPDLDQVRAAHKLGVAQVEIHTGRYAEARSRRERDDELGRIADAARVAAKLGLRVAAGHGLDYGNTRAVVGIAEIEEVNIGHAIVSRAVAVGMVEAVGEMVRVIRSAT